MLSLCAVAFGVSAAAMAADSSPAADLSPRAQSSFQEYRKVLDLYSYKAFAVEPESGEWGQSAPLGRSATAIRQAIKDCQRRSPRHCQAYAVGDVIVLGLAGWKTEVALMLYRAKPEATNDDLEAVTSPGGGAEVVALRRSMLHAAAVMGYAAAVAAMLDRGIGVDAGSEVGATALLYAASRGHRDAVALLLERGADVNARNVAGRTPLGIAVLANNFARLRATLAGDFGAVIHLLTAAGGIE